MAVKKSTLKMPVVDALLSAFPDLSSFGRVLETLDKNINDFTSRDDTRESGIEKVVDLAIRQRWLTALLLQIEASEWGQNTQIVQLKENHPALFGHRSPSLPPTQDSRALGSHIDLTALVRSKYLGRPYRDLSIKAPADFVPYSQLFRHIVESTTSNSSPPDFTAIANNILSSTSQYPLRIDGTPGTGKSSFLSLIYLALESVCSPKGGPLLFYLDLHTFETAQDAQRTLGDHLKAVSKAIAKRPDSNAILLVDGLDDYTPHVVPLEKAILSFIGKHSQIKKVVGIGLSSVTNDPLWGSGVAQTGEPETRILLRAVPMVSDRYEPFVADFLALQQLGSPTSLSTLLNTVKVFRPSEIDLLTVSLLLKFHQKAPLQLLTMSDLYEQYCRSVVGDDLGAAAALAYRFTIGDELPPSEAGPWNAAWRLIHWHATMRDFLVAWHIQATLDRVAAGDPSGLQDLDHVYPYPISRFSKELITRNEQEEVRFLKALKAGFENAGTNARAHLAYLAGRLTRFGPRKRALQLLTKWRDDIALPIAISPNSTESELLLARTIYISLVDLGDQESCDKYLELLVDNRNWSDLNRGFHLEYYGDLSYQSLTHRDPINGDWSKTYSYLFRKVSGEDDHALFEVELFTLFSLAQHRHARELLTEQQRADLSQLASRLLDQGNIRSGILRRYLAMMREHLGSESFRIGSVAEKLYGLKQETRKGWDIRQLGVRESVAEHVFGALLLGMLYLPPENQEWEGYDKRKVLRLLFAHDLAEAITGDIINKNDDEQHKEHEAYEYLGLLGTYDNVEGARDLFRGYQEFDQRASLNARIAHDLDRLENLMQLYVFRSHFSKPSDFRRWKVDLTNGVETAAGHRIMQIIEDNFKDTQPSNEK